MTGGVNLERILLGGEDGRRDTPLTALAKIDRNFREIGDQLRGAFVSLRSFGLRSHEDSPNFDNTSRLISAIDSGEPLLLPRGTFLYESLTGVDGMRIAGMGARSILKLADGADTHCLSLTDIEDVEVCDLTIDGNRAGQAALGHGIRVQGTTLVRVRSVNILNAPNYGIGVIGTGGVTGLYIDDVYIEDSGADGIDIKNQDDINEDIRISNLTVNGFDGSAVGAKAGVDVRGPVRLNNIQVFDTTPGNLSACIRFREGEPVSAVNGEGGFRSVLTNFRCITSAGAVASTGLTVNADRISIANGYIEGNASIYGASIGGSKNVIDNLQIATAAVGIRFNYTDADLDSSDNRVSNFVISDAAIGIDVRDNCDRNSLHQGSFFDCPTALRILAADDTFIGGGMQFVGCAAPINDAGTRTKIGGNGIGGLTVEASLLSDALACDSTGTRVTAITHGLTYTPDPKDVALSIIQDTAVADPRFNLLRVDGCSSTTITVRAVVLNASATGGATFRIGARVRVKA
ncbi:hypothetical protein [Microcystis phage Mwe-JY08]